MHTTNLSRIGGSIMLAVPPAPLDVLKLSAGARVGLNVENGRLVVEPKGRPRYTLDELLAQCDPVADAASEDCKWFGNGPVGDELL